MKLSAAGHARESRADEVSSIGSDLCSLEGDARTFGGGLDEYGAAELVEIVDSHIRNRAFRLAPSVDEGVVVDPQAVRTQEAQEGVLETDLCRRTTRADFGRVGQSDIAAAERYRREKNEK